MAIGLRGTAKRRIIRTEAARRWLHFLGTDNLYVCWRSRTYHVCQEVQTAEVGGYKYLPVISWKEHGVEKV